MENKRTYYDDGKSYFRHLTYVLIYRQLPYAARQ